MMLSLVNRDDAAKQLAALGGAPDSIEVLAELLRAEVHARKHAPRAATLARVARLLAPAGPVDEERLAEVCDALEREGDFVLAPGGMLYATPTRVVVLGDRARVFTSLTSPVLAAALAREVTATGAARSVAFSDGLAEAVKTIEGKMVTPETWSGLDRTPNADAAFVEMLDQRLEWESLDAGSLEKDGPLEWRTWQVASDGARWRRSDEGRLWWARTRFGGHRRAWTASASPSTSRFVELRADEADRARFALAREVAGASLLRVERTGQHAIIEIPGWLPRPEYRWLSLRAAPVPDSKGTRWQIAAADEAQITTILGERLGFVVEVQ